MSLQTLIVIAVVGIAFIYAAWSLGPSSLRRRIAARLATLLGGTEARGLRGRVANRMAIIAAKPGGGCNDCPANVLTPAERGSRAKRR
jgi:hypothetical protein